MKKKVFIVILIAALITAFFGLNLGRFLTLDFIKAQQAAVATYYAANPALTVAGFMAVYILAVAVSIPGAAILTLAAGAIFGVVMGTAIVSVSSTVGATLAFLASRYVLRETVENKFSKFLTPINAGVEKEGALYLFTLRLVPAVPFFLINLAMGLTKMKTWTFFWVSQLGMLFGTIIYVNAGTELASISSVRDILKPGLIGAFILLGIAPIIAKKIVDFVKARKVYAGWQRPQSYSRNMVVIGAGAAGLVSSYIAAAVKAKVTLIERHKMGGDCLNTGCVPSKAMIKSAKLIEQIQHASDYGLANAKADVDFTAIMARIKRVIADIEPHDSVARYSALGVECLAGSAKILSPWEVEVTDAQNNKTVLTTKNIVIAAGARPFVPPIPGLAEVVPLTSDTVWNLTALPRRLVVLGGGPIGCELTQCFARLGANVTQVEMAPRLMAREDADVSAYVEEKFRSEKVDVRVGHKALAVEIRDGEKCLIVESSKGKEAIAFDEILCAVGRIANMTGYGLEELGINTGRTVEVNGFLETKFPNIFAAGDVAGPYQFTHTAAHMAWYAAVNALFGTFKKFSVDYSVVPWATFTDPEVARVGLNEQEALEKKIPFAVHRYGIDDLDRAIADGTATGFVKVLTSPGKDNILGVTIVGDHAGDLLAEYVLAMKHGLGLNKILGTIHTYPTMSEANKYAAGVYKRSTVTHGQMQFATAYQTWRRGETGFGSVLGAIGALFSDKRQYYTAPEAHPAPAPLPGTAPH
jgi:pyruvate/2-oxoglutarate dehydrogenase complex dihydrolipoamide dehydrogenase (E3) component/uncharacterized membrane protein YdjX (TVP38/TMEM64 family)